MKNRAGKSLVAALDQLIKKRREFLCILKLLDSIGTPF